MSTPDLALLLEQAQRRVSRARPRARRGGGLGRTVARAGSPVRRGRPPIGELAGPVHEPAHDDQAHRPHSGRRPGAASWTPRTTDACWWSSPTPVWPSGKLSAKASAFRGRRPERARSARSASCSDTWPRARTDAGAIPRTPGSARRHENRTHGAAGVWRFPPPRGRATRVDRPASGGASARPPALTLSAVLGYRWRRPAAGQRSRRQAFAWSISCWCTRCC